MFDNQSEKKKKENMNRGQFSRRKTLAKSRYTLGGWLIPQKILQQRIYEPNYQLQSNNPTNFDHIQVIIRNCLAQEIEHFMPVYDAAKCAAFVRNVSNDIKFRIQIQNFNRYRSIVIVNVTEEAQQGINWQVGTLFDSTQSDGWTCYEHKTATYIVTVFVASVYWN